MMIEFVWCCGDVGISGTGGAAAKCWVLRTLFQALLGSLEIFSKLYSSYQLYYTLIRCFCHSHGPWAAGLKLHFCFYILYFWHSLSLFVGLFLYISVG